MIVTSTEQLFVIGIMLFIKTEGKKELNNDKFNVG